MPRDDKSEASGRGASAIVGYEDFLTELKSRISSAQLRAAVAVNKELVLLYWQIGRDILNRQQQQGWGAKVINRLAADLQKAFPEMKGFSRTNLMYMRAFAEAYPDEQIVQQVVGQIPWGHNVRILDTIKDQTERLWYVQQTIQYGWSRNVLVHQIESKLYHRQGKATNNFNRTLPQPQSELAQQLLKDPYSFDFLNLATDFLERDLERALINHIRDFFLELGVGFAFVGSQYHLEVGGEDFYIDLLFYHLRLRCYIVIDLKIEEFKPEFSGKMNFYVSAVDDLLRHPDDQPTIGMILCKSKNKVIAEYSLRDMHKPISVSAYQLKDTLPEPLKGNLPTIEQLEAELETVSIIEIITGLSGSDGKMQVTHYPLDEAYQRLRLRTKKTEFSPEEIGNEVAKIRSEINANTTKDSD
ncbi:MAG: PDDEXK nuclease domain-containing protein [Nostoc sp.]|uniref:PDDEXK nuclease domain-containing protein n=1 Tax=Nostoc sp. TaxID=1180 RepID=UPI002FFD4C5A